MKEIWISSDICICTHKSFHGSPVCRCVGEGSSQILGVGIWVGRFKAFILVQPDEVCKFFHSPLYFRQKKRFKTHYSTVFFSSYFYLLLFSQRGNVNEDLWLTAWWQPRCCVYFQETHRVFDKGSWIISSILESMIFLFLLLKDVTVSTPDGLISVILIWGQTNFCFVAGLHWALLFGSWRRERQMGVWNCFLLSSHGRSWHALGLTEGVCWYPGVWSQEGACSALSASVTLKVVCFYSDFNHQTLPFALARNWICVGMGILHSGTLEYLGVCYCSVTSILCCSLWWGHVLPLLPLTPSAL